MNKGIEKICGAFLPKYNGKLSDNFTVTAHAGAMHTPANTLFSLKAGIASGADIVEFDLHMNKAGVAVLEHTYPEKAKATLEEAFALIAEDKKVKVNVDVKNPECLDQVEKLAIKYCILERVFYTGIGEDWVKYAKEKSPLVKYYLNVGLNYPEEGVEEYCEEVCRKAVDLGCIGLNLHYSGLTPELSMAARKHGLLISIWTVNETADMLVNLGKDFDNMTTQRPLKLRLITRR